MKVTKTDRSSCVQKVRMEEVSDHPTCTLKWGSNSAGVCNQMSHELNWLWLILTWELHILMLYVCLCVCAANVIQFLEGVGSYLWTFEWECLVYLKCPLLRVCKGDSIDLRVHEFVGFLNSDNIFFKPENCTCSRLLFLNGLHENIYVIWSGHSPKIGNILLSLPLCHTLSEFMFLLSNLIQWQCN